MYEDIIPITYKPGAGGNFLCHFLISAKLKNKRLIKLNDNGNAHRFGLKDISYSKEWANQNDKFIIDSLPRLIKISSIAPYFFPIHLFDVNLINKSFKKSIRISYDLDDAEEIATIFYKKFIGTTNANDIKKLIGNSTLENEIFYTKNGQQLFKNELDMTNILFVSWKEYIRGNAEDLISKLSEFTNINAIDFHKESLIVWREATLKCLD
jgi:hypothetical protein